MTIVTKSRFLGCGTKAARLSIERRQPIFWKLDWAIVGGESGPRAANARRTGFRYSMCLPEGRYRMLLQAMGRKADGSCIPWAHLRRDAAARRVTLRRAGEPELALRVSRQRACSVRRLPSSLSKSCIFLKFFVAFGERLHGGGDCALKVFGGIRSCGSGGQPSGSFSVFSPQ